VVRFAVGAADFVSVELCKPALRLPQVPTQYVLWGGGEGALATEPNDRGLKLVIHLESTLRIGGAIPTLRVPSWHVCRQLSHLMSLKCRRIYNCNGVRRPS
jgi:hypothetical protein